MEFERFEGQNKNELSMIEVAHAILEQKGEISDFETLLKEVKDYLGFSAEKLKRNTSQFYTDLNINGSFISLGENRWGLRSWYPIDFIDEEVTQGNEDEAPRRKKRKKVSAFVSSEDEIDYSNDDPEDDDEEEEEEILVDSEGVVIEAEDKEDIGKYKKDLTEIGADKDEDEEDELPDGVEGDLTVIEDDEEESDDEK
ncbi:DNA-directed RNA polymerase subunit delta [Carnobacterium funditum]|uniref:DNA-directed RNA polymerase subunit delta n=1 Tax=Carnobacterium funditum TaxID=2752 RepID=UPI0005504BBB|nr:DNA-directed RNA polymerase subunit delta [Carnobacterium funditum]